MDIKKQGELAEVKFDVRALEKGLIVSKPIGDSDHYDRIIDNGKTLLKIQIKSTAVKHTSNRSDRYKINASNGSTEKTAYIEIDYFAFYIFPENCWYIIPLKATRGRVSVNLYPHKLGVGEYEKYREAWGLLS